MRRLALLCLLLPLNLWAALQFPALSGRVVDEAGMLSDAAEQQLSQRLAGHEQASSNQVVVVTLKDLQGVSIEEYGYQLGRHWGIGQAEKNNGVLLIVAAKERKVRIEVGYGLEGVLTDALSSHIIQSVILPEFRKGNYERGILEGSDAILLALGGEYEVPEAKSKVISDTGLGWIFFVAMGIGQLLSLFTSRRLVSALVTSGIAFVLGWLLVAVGTGLFFAFITFVAHMLLVARGGWYAGSRRSHHRGRGRSGSSHWGGFGGGSGGGFGGFGGGGGSFGGGGSSGGW